MLGFKASVNFQKTEIIQIVFSATVELSQKSKPKSVHSKIPKCLDLSTSLINNP